MRGMANKGRLVKQARKRRGGLEQGRWGGGRW